MRYFGCHQKAIVVGNFILIYTLLGKNNIFPQVSLEDQISPSNRSKELNAYEILIYYLSSYIQVNYIFVYTEKRKEKKKARELTT